MAAQKPPLAAQYCVVAPDLRGIGDSAPMSIDQDKRTLAEDVKGILHALGFDRAVIVWHDRGFGAARRFALDYPKSTEGLAGACLG